MLKPPPEGAGTEVPTTAGEVLGTGWTYLKPGEWRTPAALTLSLALVVGVGFLPSSRALALALPLGNLDPLARKIVQMSGFPVLALLFFLSFPARKSALTFSLGMDRWKTFPLPIAIALVFGWLHPAPPLYLAWKSDPTRALESLIWFVAFIPLGEEWLFRGWVYNIVDKLWPDKLLTPTNPLPIAVWSSALVFSVWHFQNLGTDPTGLVLFQGAYTFFTGLWLGVLRWHSSGIRLPILAHAGLNLAASLL